MAASYILRNFSGRASFSYHHYPEISLQRTPLRPVDGNRNSRGSELTPYQRGLISRALATGLPPHEIELIWSILDKLYKAILQLLFISSILIEPLYLD